MKKPLKFLYHVTNLVLPLSESRRVLKAMSYAGQKGLERARKLKPSKSQDAHPEVSFEEAIADSGMSLDALIRHTLNRKRIWLALIAVPVLLMSSILYAAFSHFHELTGALPWRMGSMLFMLLGFTSVLVVQAMKCQYRLWMLQTGALREFLVWRQTGHSLKDTLSWYGGTAARGSTDSISETRSGL